ncbi:MAG TPA: hypothetical protein VM265_08045 [Sphingomicrobium sp.]|nr:hypothetical protein [Sphingomicrobium sp.]
MSHHLQKIFDVWDGNAEAMATDIGETGVTVRQWRNRGSIHSDHWPKIIKAAASRGARVRPEDFWPPEVVAELPRHDSADSDEYHDASASKSPDDTAAIAGSACPPDSPLPSQEADSHGPFSGASPSTCSLTSEPSNMPAASPACSTSPPAKAA